MAMKISVSSYSFSQYLKAGKMAQRDCVKYAHELGIHGIEFVDIDKKTLAEQKEEAKAIREDAEKYGVDIMAYTIGARMFNGDADADKREVERLAGQLEVAEILGAKVMRHDMVYSLTKTGAGRSFDLMLPTLAKNTKLVTEIAKEKGIVTCTENHGFISQDSDRIERLFKAVADDNFGILVDIGNFACADEDHVLAVSRLAPYAVHVHAKDFIKHTFAEGPIDGGFMTRGCNYIAGCAIGDGDVPVAQCISILKKAGYDGYVTIEYEGSEDCIDGIKRGRDYIENVIG